MLKIDDTGMSNVCLCVKKRLKYESRSTEQLFCRFSPQPTIHIHPTLPPLGLEGITFPDVFSVGSVENTSHKKFGCKTN